MIKPDAVKNNHAWSIISYLETVGFKVEQIGQLTFKEDEAAEFYDEHAGKDFFPNLLKFMSSGPVYGLVLSGDKNIIEKHRKVMGYYDPRKAEPLTIRAVYGEDCPNNAIHGSDSPEAARREINLFFNQFLKQRTI